MKRILTIIILVCYSIASFGVSLNYFYCCGKLKIVSIQPIKKTVSCKGDLKKGCCRHEKKVVKLKIDQKVSQSDNADFHQFVSEALPVSYDYNFCNKLSFANVIKESFQLPPPKLALNRNILYCVFRI